MQSGGSPAVHMMRSPLVCALVTLFIIHKTESSQNDNFRPTPIPLTEWHHDKRHGRAGTLQETFRTDAPQTVAAVPAHYWEDALRHSVYLTLVRDKIDQLIAKGEVVSTDTDHKHISKEVDDHDLWEKIKTAPFDRIKGEEPSSTNDVTIMAKGRLLEEYGGFRFAEDDQTKDKCSDESCMRGVKAMWSVKRVRQRDQEVSPGRYHYELTFSVISQTPVKERKPYENPIRTFTVRESASPYGNSSRGHELERFPLQHRGPQTLTPRPARAIWFHKNIAPPQQKIKTQHYGALDRIFSSLFSDDDDSSFETMPKYKHQQYGQHSKIGYVGAPSDQHQQINPPYQYRPPQVKHVRPPHNSAPNNYIQQPNYHQLQTPPQQYQQHQQAQPHQQQPAQYQHYPQYPEKLTQYQHFDIGQGTTHNSHNYYNSHDRRIEAYSTVKTTRPAVLPTPLPPQSSEVTNTISLDSLENTTNMPDFTPHKNNRFKQTQTKVSYFTDHVRPPIYNAPPGVFVTMDKKPFKPMPPLKLVHTKGNKPNKPIDFRPSPQLHETQPIEPDSFSDSAFRPINVPYSNNSFTDNIESTRKPEQKNRKTSPHGKKPNKKLVKTNQLSTFTPDIITAQALPEDDLENMDWTKFLGSFAKTTPMNSQAENIIITEVSTTAQSIATSGTNEDKITTALYTPYYETTAVPSPPKPKRRTRPPPQFTKPEKIKKHKRITTTSTTTSTTSIPLRTISSKPTEKPNKKTVSDLTLQASSAPTGLLKPSWEQKNKTMPSTTTATISTITTTTTTVTPTTTTASTTTKTSTTTRPPTSTTPENKRSTTTLSRDRNRFRQSTLLVKGTSVKHDKWSVIGIQKNNSTTTGAPSSFNYRRKGSNFQGYSSTTPITVKTTPISNSQGANKLNEGNFESSTNYDIYESNSVIPLGDTEEEMEFNEDDGISNNENDSDNIDDQNEFIFQATTSASDRSDDVTNLKEPTLSTQDTSSVSPQTKTKCKKKKTNQDSEKSDKELQSETHVYNTSMNETSKPNDFLDEILKYNFEDDIVNKTNLKQDLHGQESLHHDSFHLTDFFDILNEKQDQSETALDDQYDDDDDDEDDDNEFGDVGDKDDGKGNTDDEETTYDTHEKENKSSRDNIISEPKRPFSFLDLLV